MKSLLTLAALLLAGYVDVCLSQAYPVKQIRMIVPFPAGGGTDIVARLISQKLTESLGSVVIVDNRIGANGIVGTGLIAKAPPDGSTIGMATPGPITVGKSLYKSLPYDPERDLAPIIHANESANLLSVHPSIPVRSVKELVALAKARPGQLNWGISTAGSLQHLLAEMFNHAAGVRIHGVIYKGAPAPAADVAGGHIEVLWAVPPVVLPYIQSGRLRVLGVSSEKRSALLPDVPTMAESGLPRVVGTAWNGIAAPAGTPKDIIDRLNREVGAILDAPDIKERFRVLGLEKTGGTPEAFRAFLRAETAKWADVIRIAKITFE